MTYTPEQITAHIEHRAHCIGEDSHDVRILRQLLAECDAAWGDALKAAAQIADDKASEMRSGPLSDFYSRGYATDVEQVSESIIDLITKDNSHE